MIEKKRQRILEKYGASPAEIQELLEYNKNKFRVIPEHEITDEKFIEVWTLYQKEAEKNGVYITLRKYIPQFHFAIQEGISQTEEYKDATLRGNPIAAICTAESFELIEPDALELDIYPTIVGRIPILFTPNNSDFEKLVRAMVKRNEPVEIPDSMGACIVNGYNNWDRIRRYKEKWTKENITGKWQDEFKRIIPDKELYQDKYIILSNKFYSGITPEQVGMNANEWRKVSLTMRRAHECTHYITLRLFGSMQNRVQDEIIADFFAIIEAMGEYNPALALLFLGLENYPKYRNGGRLENYRGIPALSDSSFEILKKITVDAVINLNRVYLENKEAHNSKQGKLELIKKLTGVSLEELADGVN